MRMLALILLLTACSPEATKPNPEGLLYGQGRDRLCIQGHKAGFIVYASGDANCSARGTIQRNSTAGIFNPAGDEDCKISLSFNADQVSFGPARPSCAFYCGPGVVFEGKTLAKSASATAAVDFAGDPLC